ncbi:MAG: proteasome-type protease [Nevskiales bacterium]|nr:proteasome-type protease [Nevskiales bacterium]
MTYCVAIKVNEGLVFAADTRTSASVDDVRTYNKLHVFEFPGERVFVLLTAGNLATTQTVLAQLQRDMAGPAPQNLKTLRHMYDVAEYLGQLIVRVRREALAAAASNSTVDFGTTLILGGQIQGEEPALYLVYPEGNHISSSPETPFLQVGELKYGKPILDRVIRPPLSLEDAARCALVSLDSTMKSNLSVGPPLDVAIVPRNALRITHKLRLDLDTPYYARLREAWGQQLASAFRNLPRFEWEPPTLPLQQAAQAPPHPTQQQGQQQ